MLVELFEPLRIVYIRLAARHVLHVAHVHKQHLEAARVEDLDDQNPIHARRFHGDRL